MQINGKILLCALLLFIGLVTAGTAHAAATASPLLELSGFAQMGVTASAGDGLAVDGFSFSLVGVLGDFSAQLGGSFTQSADDSLSFASSGVLGNIRLNSSLALAMSPPAFKSLQGGMAFTLADVEFVNIVSIGVPQTASYNQLSWTATGSMISAKGTIKLYLCPLAFDSTNVCVTFDWPECDTSITGCIAFKADNGFNALNLSISDYVLAEDFLGIRAALDAVLSFTLEQKTLSPTLRLEPNWFICPEIQLLSEFTTGGTPITVSSLAFYGIVGECAFANGVTLSFADSLIDQKNSSVTGKAVYSGRFGISGPLPSCCGTTGKFEANAYFERSPAPSGSLFGVGLFTASFDLQLIENFSFSLATELPTATSDWALQITFIILW